MENYELEKSDFAAMSEGDRAKALDDNAQRKYPYQYSKPLTKVDIERKNIELNQALQEIERLKTERKEFSKLITKQWETVKLNSKEVVRGMSDITETVWEVNNFESQFMEIINSDGLIVTKVRLKSGVQMNIFNAQKKAI